MAEPRRILFVRTDRLGEVVLNLPVLAALRMAYPQARITAMLSPELAPLLDGVPSIDRQLVHRDGPRWAWGLDAARLAARWRIEQFDLVIISNPKKAFHLAALLAGIPRRVGYDRKWSWCLTDRLPDRKGAGERHEIEYNLELLGPLRLPSADHAWELPRYDREQVEVLQILDAQGIAPSEPFIAVHPWASTPAKRWPAGRYRELLRRITGDGGVRIVVIGGPEAVAEAPAVLPPEGGAVNLVGRLSLRQLAELLRRARLLISNDSGPMHVAAAVGTRTVVLFGTAQGGAGPRRWGPWGEGHTVISKPSLDEITVEEVASAVQRALQMAAPQR
jgi:heptosyltransferase-2